MTLKHFLTTTMLGSALLFGATHMAYAETKDAAASSKLTATSMNLASQRFLESVNYARIAIAMNNVDEAKKHINTARSLVTVLKSNEENKDDTKSFRSGRIHYKYDTRYKDHYFPISAGPVAVKKISRGPLWANTKGIAVTDAEIVYLTLDLSGDRAQEHLDAAYAALGENDLTEAQSHLGELVSDVVEEDESVDIPLEKARDNIALTRQFIATRNYDGARFALKHADDALDDMQDDKRYINRKAVVDSMSKEVKSLQDQIALKDPTVLAKVDRTLDKWWKELKN